MKTGMNVILKVMQNGENNKTIVETLKKLKLLIDFINP